MRDWSPPMNQVTTRMNLAVCDHLIVEYLPSRQVVGTYRLQTGVAAGSNLGYYSEREFDFCPYEAIRSELVELGRACIHCDHRSTDVLYLLWRGIAGYALRQRARYLIGCSSLTFKILPTGLPSMLAFVTGK